MIVDIDADAYGINGEDADEVCVCNLNKRVVLASKKPRQKGSNGCLFKSPKGTMIIECIDASSYMKN